MESDRYTRYDNPAWGDLVFDVEAFPKLGNRAFQDYYGRPRPQNLACQHNVAHQLNTTCQPNNIEASLRIDHSLPSSHYRNRNTNYIVPLGNMEHCPAVNNNQAQNKDTTLFEAYSNKDKIPTDELDGLCTLAEKSFEE